MLRKMSKALLALLVSFFMISCTNEAETSIKELEMIVAEVESNLENYTEEDYKVLVKRLEGLKEKYSDVEYTAEQLKEIEELNAKLEDLVSEDVVNQVGEVLKAAGKKVVKGFMNVVDKLYETVHEIDDAIEEMDDDSVEGMDDAIDNLVDKIGIMVNDAD